MGVDVGFDGGAVAAFILKVNNTLLYESIKSGSCCYLPTENNVVAILKPATVLVNDDPFAAV